MHREERLSSLSGVDAETTWRELHFTPVSGQSVLEIGVGLGYSVLGLRRAGCFVSALDISSVALDRVRDVCEAVYEAPEDLPESRFDWALSLNVVQHIADIEHHVFHVIRSLRPGGTYALWTAWNDDPEKNNRTAFTVKDQEAGRCWRDPAFWPGAPFWVVKHHEKHPVSGGAVHLRKPS